MGDAPRTAHTDSHAKTPASMTTRALKLGSRGVAADVFLGERIPVSTWMHSGRRPIFFPSIGSSIFLTLFRSVVCWAKPNHVSATCQHVCATFFRGRSSADDRRRLRRTRRSRCARIACASHAARKQVTTRLRCEVSESRIGAHPQRRMRAACSIGPFRTRKLFFVVAVADAVLRVAQAQMRGLATSPTRARSRLPRRSA